MFHAMILCETGELLEFGFSSYQEAWAEVEAWARLDSEEPRLATVLAV